MENSKNGKFKKWKIQKMEKNKKRIKNNFLAKKLTMKNYLKNTHSLIGFSY